MSLTEHFKQIKEAPDFDALRRLCAKLGRVRDCPHMQGIVLLRSGSDASRYHVLAGIAPDGSSARLLLLACERRAHELEAKALQVLYESRRQQLAAAEQDNAEQIQAFGIGVPGADVRILALRRETEAIRERIEALGGFELAI